MATVKVYKGKRKTSYQLTIFKGYTEKDGKKVQARETVTYSLEEMGINPLTDKGNPKSESTILKDVQLYADNLEKKLTCTNYIKGDKITFEEFTQEWLKWAENHFSASTLYSYRGHLKKTILPELGTIKVGKITTERLEEFYLSLTKDGARKDGKAGGYCRSSIQKFHKIITSIMNYAEKKKKIIDINPCDNAEIPKAKDSGKIKYLTTEQALKLLEIIENPSPTVVTTYYEELDKSITKVYDFNAKKMTKLAYMTYSTLFRVALYSGMRVGELSALTWRDIDYKTNTIRINKAMAYAKSEGGSYIKEPKTPTSVREVIIPQSEINALKKLEKHQKEVIMILGSAWEGYKEKDKLKDNFVFTQVTGKMLWKSAPNRILHRLINNYNATVEEKDRLPLITMHALRHTSATLLIANDMDIKELSARLGHKNIQTTLDIYAHPLKERDQKASDILAGVLTQKKA